MKLNKKIVAALAVTAVGLHVVHQWILIREERRIAAEQDAESLAAMQKCSDLLNNAEEAIRSYVKTSANHLQDEINDILDGRGKPHDE